MRKLKEIELQEKIERERLKGQDLLEKVKQLKETLY